MSEEQQSGIFEPKPLQKEMMPESGEKKARRIIIVAAAIALVLTVFLMVRNLWFSPVKQFYKGMSNRDIAQMAEAFPKWLRDADMGQENVNVADMCSIMISNKTVQYGANSTAKVSLVGYTETDADKLTQIAEGIESQFQIKVKVTKGRKCTMNVKYKAEDGKVYDKTEYVTMYRINGSWRILDVPNIQQ